MMNVIIFSQGFLNIIHKSYLLFWLYLFWFTFRPWFIIYFLLKFFHFSESQTVSYSSFVTTITFTACNWMFPQVSGILFYYQSRSSCKPDLFFFITKWKNHLNRRRQWNTHNNIIKEILVIDMRRDSLSWNIFIDNQLIKMICLRKFILSFLVWLIFEILINIILNFIFQWQSPFRNVSCLCCQIFPTVIIFISIMLGSSLQRCVPLRLTNFFNKYFFFILIDKIFQQKESFNLW